MHLARAVGELYARGADHAQVSMTHRVRVPGPAQALVEFALILPVTLLLMLGLIEIGRGFVFGVTIQDGAHQGARMAANARVNPAITDTMILQRLIDGASPALAGCVLPTPVTTFPVTLTSCGGGNWTLALAITPNGSATSRSSFSALSAAELGQLNGAKIEVKAVGEVSLLAGLNTGSAGLSLPQIHVQGDAIMVVL
jgi:Flp pilus assembly protein TadG